MNMARFSVICRTHRIEMCVSIDVVRNSFNWLCYLEVKYWTMCFFSMPSVTTLPYIMFYQVLLYVLHLRHDQSKDFIVRHGISMTFVLCFIQFFSSFYSFELRKVEQGI